MLVGHKFLDVEQDHINCFSRYRGDEWPKWQMQLIKNFTSLTILDDVVG